MTAEPHPPLDRSPSVKRDYWEGIIKELEDSGQNKVQFAEERGVKVHSLRYWHGKIRKNRRSSHFGTFKYTVTKYPETLMRAVERIKDDIILGIAKGDLPPEINRILSTTECLNCDSKTLDNTSPGKITYICPSCSYIHFLPLRKNAKLEALGSRNNISSGVIFYLALEAVKGVLTGSLILNEDECDESSA